MGRALQSRTWACGRRRRGATGASCWPGCATCTRAAWRTATSSPRTSCWTTTTTSRSPTSGWLRCSGTARASGCWRACAARCPTPRPRCWRRPRAPTAPRPPTCGPPRSCCSPCSSASCRGSARRRRTRAGRRGRRGRRRARARRRCRSRGCRRTRWRCCGARCSRRPRRARRWSGCCACAGSSKKRRRCAPGARSPAPPTPTRPTPTCRPPTWTRCSATRSPRSPTTCCWPRSTTRPARRYRPPRAPPSAHAVDGTFNADDVFLPQNELIMQRLVRRMTRVRLRCDEATALRALCEAARALGYTTRRLDHSRVAIECDAEVRMRAWAARAAGGALLELRRSRGCGLQFKRRYLRLRDALRPLAEPDD
ncbi:pre-mRNA-splicing factor cwc22 isoform X7 [Ostrinia furnacalis]|uniref:pre-mRNA-splicing factor cwc22 isoform X7 n=1 Tax=Ostrinia furnacalis TaxID=93504 RepID=UPI001040E0C3|nr:pre-mRNA-splicing factor cwc22 isoform X7 [Ostrinia furnacalis]